MDGDGGCARFMRTSWRVGQANVDALYTLLIKTRSHDPLTARRKARNTLCNISCQPHRPSIQMARSTRYFKFLLRLDSPARNPRPIVHTLRRVHRAPRDAKLKRRTPSARRLPQPKPRHPLRVHRPVHMCASAREPVVLVGRHRAPRRLRLFRRFAPRGRCGGGG